MPLRMKRECFHDASLPWICGPAPDWVVMVPVVCEEEVVEVGLVGEDGVRPDRTVVLCQGVCGASGVGWSSDTICVALLRGTGETLGNVSRSVAERLQVCRDLETTDRLQDIAPGDARTGIERVSQDLASLCLGARTVARVKASRLMVECMMADTRAARYLSSAMPFLVRLLVHVGERIAVVNGEVDKICKALTQLLMTVQENDGRRQRQRQRQRQRRDLERRLEECMRQTRADVGVVKGMFAALQDVVVTGWARLDLKLKEVGVDTEQAQVQGTLDACLAQISSFAQADAAGRR